MLRPPQAQAATHRPISINNTVDGGRSQADGEAIVRPAIRVRERKGPRAARKGSLLPPRSRTLPARVPVRDFDCAIDHRSAQTTLSE